MDKVMMCQPVSEPLTMVPGLKQNLTSIGACNGLGDKTTTY